MPDAVALVEARTALATLQSELATAHKQWDEGGKNWDAVTILAGNDFDKYQAMMEKETKANELGKEVERLAALESSQGMMDRIGNNAVQNGVDVRAAGGDLPDRPRWPASSVQLLRQPSEHHPGRR